MSEIEIIEGDQGTAAWFQMRCGSVGASSMQKIITTTGKRSAQRKAFLYQMAAERITGKKTETYTSKHMENGILREEDALDAFSFVTGLDIRPVSLIRPTDNPNYHCSPDSIVVGKEEGVEVKSVIPSTQVKYLDRGTVPTEYIIQVQASMMVTGWPVWWFASYCPGMRLLILPVKRDEKLISQIRDAVESFCRDMMDLVERLKA